MEELTKFSHKELVEIGYRWLNNRTGFTLKEFACVNPEIPDLIGFRSGISILIECKASRSDFLADKNKWFRKEPACNYLALGNYRLYCCPEGMIKAEELPAKWGLIYVNSKGKAKITVNCFNPKGGNIFTVENRFESCKRSELAIMYSVIRRMNIRGRLEEIYQPMTNTRECPRINQSRHR